MKPWIIYALISMLFAGLTSVIAKLGLTGISAELGLTIRTCFVFAFVLAFAFMAVPSSQLSLLTRGNYLRLAFSALTTAVSWVFYYKAIKDGEVSTVALYRQGKHARRCLARGSHPQGADYRAHHCRAALMVVTRFQK